MTRILLLASAIAVSAMIAGCDSSATLAQVEASAEAAAQATCGFVPTADTIAKIVIPLATSTAGAGSSLTVEQASASVAEAICGAVTAKSASYGHKHTPMVHDVSYGALHASLKRPVIVKGHFVH